jgi:hypothetical protein
MYLGAWYALIDISINYQEREREREREREPIGLQLLSQMREDDWDRSTNPKETLTNLKNFKEA